MVKTMNVGVPTVTYAGSSNTNREVDRLFCAAVISKQFCSQLLKDPSKAVSQGYQNEHFNLPVLETRRMQSVRAAGLKDFASQYLRTGEPAFVHCSVAAGD